MRRAAALIAISVFSIACAAPAAPGWTFPPDASASARPGASTLEVAGASPSPSASPSVAVQLGADAGIEMAAAVAPSSASVTIADFAFGPATVTIAAGGKVTWTNRDTERHSVLIGDIESSRLESGATYAQTFDSAGRFAYACGLHPRMVGTILVVEAGADVPVAPAGGVAVPGTATSTAEPTAGPTTEPTADPTPSDDAHDEGDHSGHGGGGDDEDHSGHGGGGDDDDDHDHSGPGGGGSGHG